MMNTEKKLGIISAVLLTLQIVAEGFLVWILARLNMLPTLYFLIVIGLLLFFAALTAVLLFLKKKKPVGLGRRIIGWFLAFLTIGGCLLAGKLAFDAYKAIDQVTTKQTSVLELYVLVRTEDPAQTVQDTGKYSYGIIAEYDEEHTQQAIARTEELIQGELEVVSFEKITDVADGLLDGEVDAILMNGAAVALLIEDEDYEDFLQKARILHTFRLETLEEVKQEEEPEVPVEVGTNISNTPFVLYCSGSDTRSKILRVSRSDVNILAVVNPVTKQILLINTPRDYYVSNPAGKGKKDKLTHCGLYGTENSMQALGDLYGINIDYYAQVNFSGFETLVDAVGGITVHSDQEFDAGHFVHIEKGINNLNGSEALAFARERYNVSGGDRSRGKNQMKVITAIVKKMTTGTTLISGYRDILNSMEGMFKTDITGEEISMLVKMQLADMASWNIQSYAVSGTGGSDQNYSSPGTKAYVMYPDQATVDKAAALVQQVIAGKMLTAEDVK